MASILSETQSLDTSNLLGSTQNDCHFTDKCIFLHGNCCIFLEIPFNLVNDVFQIFLAATKQLYEWLSQSVCLSVCLSIRHTFFAMFPPLHHPEIFRSYYQSQKWCPCKRSRSKVRVTEVTTQLHLFRTVTPVWIHIWWWNDAYSLMMLRRGALLFLKVIHQISRSRGSKKHRIWPRLGVSGL